MTTEVTMNKGQTVVATRYYGGVERGPMVDVYMTVEDFRRVRGRRVRIDDYPTGETFAQAVAGRTIRFRGPQPTYG